MFFYRLICRYLDKKLLCAFAGDRVIILPYVSRTQLYVTLMSKCEPLSPVISGEMTVYRALTCCIRSVTRQRLMKCLNSEVSGLMLTFAVRGAQQHTVPEPPFKK